LDRICVNPINIAAADACIGTGFTCLTIKTAACYTSICNGTLKLTINCNVGGCDGGKPSDCAHTSGSVINICDLALITQNHLPKKGCQPLGCVIAHEMIHACGQSHPGSGARNGNNDVVSDCHCFECLKNLFALGACDGSFYTYHDVRVPNCNDPILMTGCPSLPGSRFV
jgi:hypothetical protein